MAYENMITDPDDLVDGASIVIDTSGKTVQLVVTGLLTTDGVTIKAVYSKLKELWKNSSDYIKFPLPMGPITDEQFEMVNGWDWKDDTTRYLLRTGGWAVKDNAGVSTQEWASIVSLGEIGATDQAYFLQSAEADTQNFVLTGPVNQAVRIYKTSTGGAVVENFRSFFKVYCRIYQKTYASSQLSEIGVTSLTYQAYRFPLANSADAKITHNDAAMSGAPYSGMTITWYDSPQQRSIGGINYNFHVIVGGNSGTAEQIYEFVQYKLRQATDIDDGGGTQIGKKTSALLKFVGDTLYTQEVTEGGVFIDAYLNNDVNRLVMTDDNGDEWTFPYTAVLTLNFGENLVADAAAKYWVYFTNDDAGDNLGRDYGTATAILVNDYTSTGIPMTGDVDGAASVAHTFAYASNIQRGAASAGVDAPITCVAIGLSTGQFVKATGTITRSVSNSVSLVAPLERNYSNV